MVTQEKAAAVAVINGITNGQIVNGMAKPAIASINGSANGIVEGKIHIRPARAEDAQNLRALIQELADHQDMPDGPRIGAFQVEKDFRSGAIKSMVAIGPKGDMAAYAVYYFQPSSSSRGQILHLEDLYIRPQYRRRGLGIKLLREVSKIAHAQRLPCVEWCVLRTNYGALNFYNKLPGIEDLTDRREANKSICWRWEREGQEQTVRKAKAQQRKIEVLLDEPGQIGERNAQRLADQWNGMIGQEERKEGGGQYKPMNGRTRKQLASGQLGAIVVQSLEKPVAEAAGEDQQSGQVLGMALFHRKAYSTWQGKFPELDQIYVAEPYRRKGIGTAIMAELAKIAQSMGATKVQWTAPEPSKAKSQHVPFFDSLNAANLTDIEDWLLYRWHYEQAMEKENCRKEAVEEQRKNC